MKYYHHTSILKVTGAIWINHIDLTHLHLSVPNRSVFVIVNFDIKLLLNLYKPVLYNV